MQDNLAMVCHQSGQGHRSSTMAKTVRVATLGEIHNKIHATNNRGRPRKSLPTERINLVGHIHRKDREMHKGLILATNTTVGLLILKDLEEVSGEAEAVTDTIMIGTGITDGDLRIGTEG